MHGKTVFIRTVTYHYTGLVIAWNDRWIELQDAAWIPNDGRFHDFLKTGIPEECEPYIHPVRVMLAAIVDITLFPHPLPREQK